MCKNYAHQNCFNHGDVFMVGILVCGAGRGGTNACRKYVTHSHHFLQGLLVGNTKTFRDDIAGACQFAIQAGA